MRQTINRGALIASSIVPAFWYAHAAGFWWFVAAAAPFLLYVATMTDEDGKKAEEVE
ncbi:hypothetical protein [Bacillus pumilus]|jgi:hypothetical protein|uniref:hypothetical protein n=1 Tax=Bacillus pumilus TaxID=1408 RepID=UPI0012DB6E56|nr:hypothetical protein [Bacillus pumilus]MBR0588531.1 hypothetical protein [Bacillus pumilus DW2J2]MBR0618429.1 hypothetical protein [Bacillus pumilus]MBR0624724.1 hypothetical protein [Bacillus pumilus]MCY7724082.1 hypothetical protein [Bacillus pumilus]MCY7747429.1 hypothetical protein [Bacillus pumilus]